jgi:hypothetical protein
MPYSSKPLRPLREIPSALQKAHGSVDAACCGYTMQEQQPHQRSRGRTVAASVFALLAVAALVGTAPQLQATALKFFKGSGFPDDIYM